MSDPAPTSEPGKTTILFLETSLTLKKRTEVSSHSFLDLTESIILFFCIEMKMKIENTSLEYLITVADTVLTVS